MCFKELLFGPLQCIYVLKECVIFFKIKYFIRNVDEEWWRKRIVLRKDLIRKFSAKIFLKVIKTNRSSVAVITLKNNLKEDALVERGAQK